MRAPRYRSAHIFIVKPYVIDVEIKKAVIWMIDAPLILYDRADTMASPLQMARIVAASWIWSGHIAHPSEGIDRTESTHNTANIASRMLRSWGRRESSTVKRYEAPMQTTSRHTAFLSNRWFQELHESTEEPTVVALTRLHTAGRLALR